MKFKLSMNFTGDGGYFGEQSLSANREQLILQLRPTAPYALSYFVSHSGVGEAYLTLQSIVDRACEDSTSFSFVYIFGRAGTGKTHLLKGFHGELKARNFPEEQIALFEFSDAANADEIASKFVSEYERLKKQGGVLLVEAPQAPEALTANPHLLSRFKSAQIFQLELPSESELQPVIQSLSERHNLRLSAQHIQYLLKHMPRDLLSFDDVLAKMSEFSLKNSRPAKFPVIREMVKGEEF